MTNQHSAHVAGPSLCIEETWEVEVGRGAGPEAGCATPRGARPCHPLCAACSRVSSSGFGRGMSLRGGSEPWADQLVSEADLKDAC